MLKIVSMGSAHLFCKLFIDFCLLPMPKGGRSEVVGIVRLDAIGDFVVWLPAAQALIDHQRAKQKQVVLIVNQLWAPWAERLLEIDQVVAVDVNMFDKSLRYRIFMLQRIRRLLLGSIIVPAHSRIPGDGNDAIAFASGARTRIANKGYRSKNRFAALLRTLLNIGYSRVVVLDEIWNSDNGSMSEPEINAGFVKALGISQNVLIGKLPRNQSLEFYDLQLPVEPYVVMIPGGSWNGKAWPLERFVALALKLRAHGFEVVVSGSEDERALCEELASACSGRNIAGRTSLQTLAEVIGGARLVIGNDSAGIHIAVAAEVDSVCVMWGGSFGRFIPYKKGILPRGLEARAVYRYMDCFCCTGTCPYPTVAGKVKCIDAVPVSEVWDTVHDVLGKK